MKKFFNFYHNYNKQLIVCLFASFAAVFIVLSPTKADAMATKTGNEADGTEIWSIFKNPAVFPDIQTIPVGSYGNGITAGLISLHVSGNTTLKILGPHTFYNLTVDDGATITTDALEPGTDYTVGGIYPLTTSGINKKIDLTVNGRLQLDGTITANGLGYRGGYVTSNYDPALLYFRNTVWPFLDPSLPPPYINDSLTPKFVNSPAWLHYGQGPGGGASRISYYDYNDHSNAAGGSFGGRGAVGHIGELDNLVSNPPAVIIPWLSYAVQPTPVYDGSGNSQPVGYYDRLYTGWPHPAPLYGAVGYFGSGGGYVNHFKLDYYDGEGVSGGNGGGVIKIKAREIEMAPTGQISANGDSGEHSGTETGSGGGSGGSISVLFNEGSISHPLVNPGHSSGLIIPDVSGDNYQAQVGDSVFMVPSTSAPSTEWNGHDGITANGGNGGYLAGAGGGGRVYIGPLTLTGNLTANPASGIAPLATNLTADVTGGSATGTINYTFWWNCTNSSSDIDVVSADPECGDPTKNANGTKYDNVTDLSKVVAHTYSQAGAYQPKVIIERSASVPVSEMAIVSAIAPTLTGTLTATPDSGLAPLSSKLKATINPASEATGDVNYTFWYNCTVAGNDVAQMKLSSNCGNPTTGGRGEKHDGVSAESYTVNHIFPVGTSHIKVIIEQGAAVPIDLNTDVTATAQVTKEALELTSLSASPSTGVQPLNPSLTISYNADVAGPWDVYVYCKTANTTPNFTYLNRPDANTHVDSTGRASPWFSGSISIPPPSPDTHCAYTGSSSGAITLRVVMKNSARPTTLDGATVGLNVQVPTYGLTIAATGTGSSATISVKEFTSNQPAGVTMRYTMYCDRNDTSMTVTNGWDAQISSTQRTAVPMGVCNYLAFGTYYPKVIVEYPLGSSAVLTPVAQDTDIYNYSVGKTLSASLSASPNPAAINRAVTLTGSRSSGTATGTINYKLYCKSTDTKPILDTTTTATSEQAGCNVYSTPGSYTAKLVIVQGGVTAQALTTIVVENPSVSVLLNAIPNNPLVNARVSLNASVSGTAQGNITYDFYCLKNDTTYTKRIVSASTTAQADNLCAYSAAGSVQAMVKVSRESQSGQALATITVSSSGADGQIIFEENGGPIKIRGSLVASQVIFNARNKGTQKYSVRIYSDKNVLASRLPGFSDIMTIINQKQ